MAAGNFIKDNLALVAGIAVPVLLVVGFLLTSTIGKIITPAPAHTAYFVLQEYDYNNKNKVSIDIKVADDGKIVASVTAIKEDKNGYRPNASTDILITYDAANDKLTEHRLSAPEGMRDGTFTPEAFKDVRLSTQAEAQDGYSVVYGSRGSRSLAADIFITRGAEGYRIRKNGAVYRLPERGINGRSSPYYNSYYNTRFLGWGTEENQ